MRRRLDIARVLVPRPSILFLDEPTAGLDPQSRRVVWEMLQGFMKDYGLTVFLTTHYMDEAETLCGRVAIIDRGNIIAIGSPDELKAGLPGNDAVVLTVAKDAERLKDAAEKEPYARKVTLDNSELRVAVDNGGEDAPLLMQLANNMGIKVGSVPIQKQSLEDVFIHP